MRRLFCFSFVLGAVFVACVGDDPVVDGTSPDAGTVAPDSSTPAADAGTDSSTPVDSGVDAAPVCGAPGGPCCAGTCQGGATCNAGTCTCPIEKSSTCGGTCVDLRSDAANCGRCGHDCLGGTCSAGKCGAVTVTTGQTGANTLLVDGGRMYVARGGNAFVTGGILSVKLDGTDLKQHVDVGLNQSCSGLAIAKGKLFFSCTGGANRQLRSCELPTCATITTVRDAIGSNAGRVAADPATGKSYYLQQNAYNTATGGGIFDDTGALVGAANQPTPSALTVSGGYLYWLNSGNYASDNPQKNGGVRRVALATPTSETTVVGTNGIYFDNSGLAVDSFNVYYAGRNSITTKSDVVVAPVAGGGLTVFAADVGVSHVVSDGTTVFFDDRTNTQILYCPRATGCGAGKLPLVTGETDLTAMGADSMSVFWSKFGGEVRRIAKP